MPKHNTCLCLLMHYISGHLLMYRHISSSVCEMIQKQKKSMQQIISFNN